MTQQDIRKNKINIIKNSIRTATERGMTISMERLIATICIDFGCTRRTALEYIDMLKNSGMINISKWDLDKPQLITLNKDQETL